MNSIRIKDIGLIDYMECWSLQKEFFEKLIASKTESVSGIGQSASNAGQNLSQNDAKQIILLCEHPHVYTLGKSGKENNLLINNEFLSRIGASFYKVDRGGDITYHGPGQLVGYPILDLETLGIGLKEYIHKIEEAIICTVRRFGIDAGRSEGATGVWLQADGTKTLRKIAAIGVRSSHFVTMHGFALNVDPAMEYFRYINPCGFTDRGVTSIAQERGQEVNINEVKQTFIEEFGKVFQVKTLQ